MNNAYYELQKAISLASPVHCYEDAYYRSGLGGLDQLDMDFVLKCRKLLPELFVQINNLLLENNELVEEISSLKGNVKELEERISIMTKTQGPAEGWDS